MYSINTDLRLSRDEVTAKYGPTADPNWTTERVDAFLQSLPTTTPTVKMSPTKWQLIRDFASDTLGARRMSDRYIVTLASILGAFAVADRAGGEVVLSQRSSQHGEPRTLRTIQTQMLNAGLLVKQVRSQGHGFVGAAFVYSPRRHHRATWDDLNAMYRADEQDGVSWLQLPANIKPVDVPY